MSPTSLKKEKREFSNKPKQNTNSLHAHEKYIFKNIRNEAIIKTIIHMKNTCEKYLKLK